MTHHFFLSQNPQGAEEIPLIDSVANSFCKNSRAMKQKLQALKADQHLELSCLRTASFINGAYLHVIKKIEETYRLHKVHAHLHTDNIKTDNTKLKAHIGCHTPEKVWAKIDDYIQELASKIGAGHTA